MATVEEKLDALLAAVGRLERRIGSTEATVDRMEMMIGDEFRSLRADLASIQAAGPSQSPLSGPAYADPDGTPMESAGTGASTSTVTAKATEAAASGTGDDGTQEELPRYHEAMSAVDDSDAVHLTMGSVISIPRVKVATIRIAWKFHYADPSAVGKVKTDLHIKDATTGTLRSVRTKMRAMRCIVEGTGAFKDFDVVMDLARADIAAVPWLLVVDTGAAFLDLSVLSRVEMAIASGNKVMVTLDFVPPPGLSTMVPVLFDPHRGFWAVHGAAAATPEEAIAFGVSKQKIAPGHSIEGLASTVNLGIGWKGKRRRLRQVGVDIDLIATLLDAGGEVIDVVTADHSVAGVTHSGDDPDGRDGGVNEHIDVDFLALDREVARIVVAATATSEGVSFDTLSELFFAAEANPGMRMGAFCRYEVDLDDAYDGILAVAVLDVEPEDTRIHCLDPRWVLGRPEAGTEESQRVALAAAVRKVVVAA